MFGQSEWSLDFREALVVGRFVRLLGSLLLVLPMRIAAGSVER